MTDATGGTRKSRIEISKQALNFSIGHFTVLSATERENLHGHNYQLECAVTAPVSDEGLVFNYGILKDLLKKLCDDIDEQVILPANSPYVTIEKEDGYTIAIFNDERIPFLDRDATVLPIANATVEEFSHYFLQRLLEHPGLRDRGISEITVRIGSSPGQYGSATWSQP